MNKPRTLLGILLFCLAAWASPVSARNSTFDSLRSAIAGKPVKVRFEVMEYFADSLLNRQPLEAIPFTREAIRLAHERGDKTEEGYLLNSLCKIYLSLGEFGESGECARRALALNLEVKHEYEVARTYNLTAVTYNYMGLYTNAMEYSLKALHIYEQLKKPIQSANMLNAIGTIYLRLSQFEKANEYFYRTLTLVQKKDTSLFTILLLNNIASVRYHTGKPDSALSMLQPLLELTRRRNSTGAEAYTLFNIGQAYGEKNEYGRAVAFLQQAREASSKIHEAHGVAEASLGIARVYLKCGEDAKALAALNEAIPYCRRSRSYDLLRDALDLQRRVYERRGDVGHAYASLKAYTALTDSVFTIAEKFGVANAAFASELAEKENEISRLRQEAMVYDLSISNKQYQIYVLIAFVFLMLAAALGMVFLYRKSKRLHRTEIAQKKKIERLYDQLSKVVTEHRLADEQARDSQQKFQSVWEKSVDGMRLTDEHGTILMVNEAFCRMVRMDRSELTNKPMTVIYMPRENEEGLRLYRERFASRTVETYFERELRLKNGLAVWFEVTNTFIETEGQPPLLLGIFRDVTQRKKLERQLVQSQKLEGIGTLAGGIAHDFNNLLAMILGSAEMLQSRISDQPQLHKYVDRIVEASARGTSISRQLLMFSRPDQSQLKPVSLSQTVIEMKEMLKHFLPRTIIIQTIIEEGDDIIMGDAGQIQQALLNLAINAGDAMINNGTLTIRKFRARPDAIGCKIPAADGRAIVALSVSDTGMGMDETTKQKIFDPFFTTKAPGKGTGLGLSSVHGIVKNHDGVIEVDSASGKGSTFTIYFPAAAMPVPPPAEQKIVQGTRDRKSILLVDDEKIIRETMEEFLCQCGYHVYAAANGREALEIFKAHRDSLDIVVTDLGMPEMGGEELYGRLQELDPDVKVIVSSGYLDGTTKTDLLKIGIREVLTKPVKIHDLQVSIQSVLGPS